MSAPMLRVQKHESVDAAIFKLEGRFTREGAEHFRALITGCNSERRIVVDLAEVIFIDAVGEEVLSFLKRLGAEFTADSAYTLDVCERLKLPLVRENNSNGEFGGNGNHHH